VDDQNPYLAPLAHVEDPETTQIDPAGRGARFFAWVVNIIPIFAITFFSGWTFRLPFFYRIFPLMQPARPWVRESIGWSLLLTLFVWNLIWLHRYGQSIGKRLLRIRICRPDGSRAGLGRLFWQRMFLPSMLGTIPWVGDGFRFFDLVFIFGTQRRCIHDYIADTIVVKV